MKLSFLLQREAVLLGVNPEDGSRKSVIKSLLEHLYAKTALKEEGFDVQTILEIIMRREEELPSGVGDGFAFPHARIDGLKGFYMLLAVSREGVDFHSVDHKPVNFFVLSLVESSNPNLLLQSRAALMRFMLAPENRRKVLEKNSADEIWEMIDRSGINVSKEIVARDIMWPQVGVLNAAMTLKDAAIMLHRYHSDSLPILDDRENFLGDISCYDLFACGLPDFFSQLKTISFVRHMNPFEKYFQMDNSALVGDVKINRETPVVGPDATLMEIIFEMTAKNKQYLYVVENSKLLGVIDRFTIVDKVLVAN